MATPASRLVQDQNFNIHSAGGSSFAGKLDVPRAAKKGAITGRKALHDISNSEKPSALQASRKHNAKNVIPVAKDIGGSKTAMAVGGKANFTKAQDNKGHNRKVLGDLTNSVKPPSVQHPSRKAQEKSTAEVPFPGAIKEEGFLHNHQECIKAQRRGMNFGYFLETIGLGSPMVLPQPLKLKPESPVKRLEEMILEEIEDEMPILVNDGGGKAQLPDCSSPVHESPKSAYDFWADEENLVDFKLVESPKVQKHGV